MMRSSTDASSRRSPTTPEPAYLRYSFTKGTAQEVALLWDVLGLVPGMRVLDLGCGPGRHAAALADRGVEVVGVDISEAFLRLLPDGWPVRADVRRLPVRPGSFDAAIWLCQGGFGLLGGCRRRVRPPASSAAAIRPGGRLAVSAFSAYFAVRYLEDGDRFDAGHRRQPRADRSAQPRRRRPPVRPVDDVLHPAGAAAAWRPWPGCARWACGRSDPGDYAPRPPDLDHPELLLVATREPGSTMPDAT